MSEAEPITAPLQESMANELEGRCAAPHSYLSNRMNPHMASFLFSLAIFLEMDGTDKNP